MTYAGYFLDNKDILLANKFYQHRIGAEVVSSFLVEDSGTILLINRGWIEKSQIDRFEPTKSAKNVIKLSGIIDKIRSNPFILSRHETAINSWPAKELQLRPAAIEAALNKPIYPFQLRLSADQPQSLTRNWQPVVIPWQRHVGYAIQWALIALTSLIMIWIVNRNKDHDPTNTRENANNPTTSA